MTSLPVRPHALAPELVTAALDALATHDFDAAVRLIDEATAGHRSDPLSFYLVALLSIRIKEPAAALEALDSAHAGAPLVRETAELLAVVHSHLGHPVDALYFRKLAIAATESFGIEALLPGWVGDFDTAFFGIREKPLLEDGRKLLEAGDFADAAEAFRREVELDRHSADGWRGLREAASQGGDAWRALAAADALHSLGVATVDDAVQHAYLYAETGECEAAEILAREAARFAPDDPAAAWAQVRLAARRPGNSRAAVVAAMQHWMDRFGDLEHSGDPESVEASAQAPANRRLHLGLISGRWRDGGGLDHLIPALEVLDRRRIKLTVYALGRSDTPLGRRLRSRAETWHRLARMDRDTAKFMMGNDELDVLVDLDGPGFHADPLLLLHPPVRRKLVLRGVPRAVAIYGFDAALGDPAAYPGTAEDTPVFVSGPGLATLPADTGEPLARPEGGTLPLAFGSFARRHHLTPETVELWSAVLEDNPQATLLLDMERLGGPEAARQTLALFENRIQPGRILVRHAEAEVDDYLRAVGLLLDSVGNPDSEDLLPALGRGVPALTLRSCLPSATVAAGWLDAQGLSELVADDAEDYRLKAARVLQPENGARLAVSLAGIAAEERRHGPARVAALLTEILIKATA